MAKKPRWMLSAYALSFLLLLPGGVAVAATPQQVLVIINDTSPVSQAVGEMYVRLRKVPNVLHVRCVDSALQQPNETIDFASYRAQIEVPLRAFLNTHPGIDFLVTTKGIPIHLSAAGIGQASSGVTETSLDSYLAALDYDQLPGTVKVRFERDTTGTAWLNRYWNAHVPFTHARFGGYLVTRLDGYTQADAQALITRALAAERKLEPGRILFDVQPEFGLGKRPAQPEAISNPIIQELSLDTWNAEMIQACDDLTKRHIPAEVDLEKRFVSARRDLLGYFSWGSNDSHYSLEAYRSLAFLPGAVGETGVSTSARSFFPQTHGQSMIADLIAQGITGIKGYTDEPLLQAVASPIILLDRFTEGYTLAESYFAASRFVAWTDLVIGDPLACPYRAHH